MKWIKWVMLVQRSQIKKNLWTLNIQICFASNSTSIIANATWYSQWRRFLYEKQTKIMEKHQICAIHLHPFDAKLLLSVLVYWNKMARDAMWTLFLMQELQLNWPNIDVLSSARFVRLIPGVSIILTNTATAALIKRLNLNSMPGDTYL